MYPACWDDQLRNARFAVLLVVRSVEGRTEQVFVIWGQGLLLVCSTPHNADVLARSRRLCTTAWAHLGREGVILHRRETRDSMQTLKEAVRRQVRWPG